MQDPIEPDIFERPLERYILTLCHIGAILPGIDQVGGHLEAAIDGGQQYILWALV